MFVPGLQERWGSMGGDDIGLLLDREGTDVAQRHMVIYKGKMGNAMLG